MAEEKLITIAIYTYEKAQIVKQMLESEGIPTLIQNVNLIQPVISSGVRVRIREQDLPHALEILEQSSLLQESGDESGKRPRTVLVPVDFSEYSMQACCAAFHLAENLHAEVMLFHAYFSPYFPGAIPVSDAYAYEVNEEEALKQIQSRVEKEIRQFVEKLYTQIENGRLPQVKFAYTLREGIPEEEILRFAREEVPVLIVMGTRGKNQKELDLIGSVTAEVLDSSRYPVFAVPENVPFCSMDAVKQIGFFINFDQRELVALDTFMRLMAGFDFSLHFIHIANKQDSWDEIKLAGVKEYFQKHYPGRKASVEQVDGDDFLNQTEQVIRRNNIDMLALASRKRNIFARLFNPGIAHKMLFHSDTPLLVIPS